MFLQASVLICPLHITITKKEDNGNKLVANGSSGRRSSMYSTDVN